MPNESTNRVLSRKGAHELTKEQSESVSGGSLATLLSHIMTSIMTSPDSVRDS
jgi:hypothetical protein